MSALLWGLVQRARGWEPPHSPGELAPVLGRRWGWEWALVLALEWALEWGWVLALEWGQEFPIQRVGDWEPPHLTGELGLAWGANWGLGLERRSTCRTQGDQWPGHCQQTSQ